MNKKRIGILTMHRVQNYGSALQAYALQEYINRLGYDAELIDYIFPNGKHKQRRSLKKSIKSTLFKWIFCLPRWWKPTTKSCSINLMEFQSL